MHLGCDDVRYGNATLTPSVRGFAPPKTRGASLCLRLDTLRAVVCEWTRSASRFAPDSRLQALALLASG